MTEKFTLDVKRQLSKDNPLRKLLLEPKNVYLIQRKDLEVWAYLLESHWGWIKAHEERLRKLEKQFIVEPDKK